MKKTLLYATSAFFILGTSFAHEVAVSPVTVSHKSIVEARIVQLNAKTGTVCASTYITTITDGVKSPARKSVDCEE